jgi:hypothetical protein
MRAAYITYCLHCRNLGDCFFSTESRWRVKVKVLVATVLSSINTISARMFNPKPVEASWHNFMCQYSRVIVSDGRHYHPTVRMVWTWRSHITVVCVNLSSDRKLGCTFLADLAIQTHKHAACIIFRRRSRIYRLEHFLLRLLLSLRFPIPNLSNETASVV